MQQSYKKINTNVLHNLYYVQLPRDLATENQYFTTPSLKLFKKENLFIL